MLAVGDDCDARSRGGWLIHNQTLTRDTPRRYPGMQARYRRLVAAPLAQRPDPERLRVREAEREPLLCQALQEPGSIAAIPTLPRSRCGCITLRHTRPDAGLSDDHSHAHRGDQPTREVEDMARRRARRVDDPEQDGGLITVRMENIFTWGEHVNVDRGSDDEDDAERAEALAPARVWQRAQDDGQEVDLDA